MLEANPSAPFLSVLMPVFNERDTVERAIGDVLEADLGAAFELIVVDDGSTDGTLEILRAREWGDRVSLYEHERNMGKGAAVRTALKHARGELSAIFDADLEYDPEDLHCCSRRASASTRCRSATRRVRPQRGRS